MSKFMKIVLSFILVLIGVSGCSNDEGSSATAEKIQLSFATPDSGPNVEMQQLIVDEYNASQDKVEVVLQAYGSAFDQKLTASAGTDSAPDVVKVWNYSAYSSLLKPLNDNLDQLDNYKDFYPALWQYTSVKDQIYGVPTGWSTRALYVDEAKLASTGVTIDPNNWSLKDLRNALVAAGDQSGLYAFYDYQAYSLESFSWIYGSDGWIDNKGKSNLSDGKNVKLFEDYRDLIYKDKAVKLNSQDSISLDSDFATGNYLFADYGYWLAPTIAAANSNFAVYPFPGEEGGNGPSVIHASGLAVMNDSEYAQEAMDFISYYTNYDNITRLTEFEMPVRQSVADDMNISSDALYKPYFDTLVNSEGYQSSMLKTEKWGEVESLINEMIQEILMDENAEVSVLTAEYDQKINEILG